MAKHRAKDTSKSAVSNGTRIWPTDAPVDGRGQTARRQRDLLEALAAQLGRAFDELDVLSQQRCRRIAALLVLLEADEARLAAGRPLDVGGYLALIDRANAQLQALDLARRTPRRLDDEADERARQRADADAFHAEMLAALESDDGGEPEPRRRLRRDITDPHDDGTEWRRPARSEADD